MRVAHAGIFFFFNDTATTEIYTLSLHDALPISTDIEHRLPGVEPGKIHQRRGGGGGDHFQRSEEHTSEIQSLKHIVIPPLLLKKNQNERHSPKTLLYELRIPRQANNPYHAEIES